MEKTVNNPAQNRNYVLPIIIMFALFFMIAFVTGYQNPLGSVIEKKTVGNAFMSQLPTFANFIAYAFMGIPAGVILQRKGYRVTAMLAVVLGFTGVLVSFLSGTALGDNVPVYLVGAFISGFSMCLLNTVVNPMLNSLGSNDKKGNQLVQFGGTCNSLGATLAPAVVGYLMGNTATNIADANPVFYMAMIIFAIAFIVLFFSKLPESPTLGMKQEKVDMAGAFKFSNFTFGVIAIFIYMGIEIGVANFSLLYMTKGVGIPMSTAGALVGMYWLLMLVGRLTGGIIGGMVSSRAMLTVVSSLVIVLLVAAISMPETSMIPFIGIESANGFHIVEQVVPVSAVLLLLCGLGTSVMWGAIFNLSVSGLGKYTQVASGIFMVMVCGGGILPLIQSSIIGESTAASAFLDSYWLVVAFAAYELFYALVGSRVKKA